MDIHAVLATAAKLGASDLHLKVGGVPMLRVHGDLVPVEGAMAVGREQMQAYLAELMSDHHELLVALLGIYEERLEDMGQESSVEARAA